MGERASTLALPKQITPCGVTDDSESNCESTQTIYALEEVTQTSNELTLALIRPIPNWSPWIIWKPGWAEMVDVAQKVASDWKAEKERMTARMNGFVRSPNLEAMSERELFHTVAKQR